jgi:hypothetical protein
MLTELGQNFRLAAGTKLPIPYIDRALVNDSNMILQVSFFVVLNEEQEIEEVTDSLSDIYFYIAQVFDGEPENDTTSTYTSTEIDAGNTARADDVIHNNKGVMNYLVNYTNNHTSIDNFVNSSGETYMFTGHKELIQLSLSDFSFAGEQYEGGQRVIKYTIEVTTSTPTMYSTGQTEFFLNASEHGFDLCLLGFSSPIGGLGAPTTTSPIEESKASKGAMDFYNSFFSQVSYEKVFESGNLSESPTVLYTTLAGDLIDGEVVQVIGGGFHLLGGTLTIEGMLSQLQELATTSVGTTPAFTEALDGYNYILSVYGETEELLPRLDLFRKTYLDKSSATQMGKWYLRFNRALNRLNGQASQGTLLRRELVLTPTVVDNRSFDDESYEVPTDLSTQYSAESDYVFTNDGAIQMGRLGHYGLTEMEGGASSAELENYDYTLIENGYFFFDLEKALKTQSVLSKVLGIEPVENYFGKSVTNQYFKLKRITVNRKGEDGSFIYSKICEFNHSMDDTYPQLTQMYYLNTDGTTTAAESEYNYSDNIIYPQLMPRNVSFIGNDSLNDYRMMAIQFQDIMPSAGVYGLSPRDTDNITITVAVVDYTKQLISDVTESLSRYLSSSFGEYVESAEQFCSYNNIDGFFNNFFVESVNSPYIDSPESAPWVVAPVIYNIHKDIITNQFGGDLNKTTDASIVINNQISPETGNLSALLKFRDNVQGLLSFYENLDLSGYSHEQQLEFGGKSFSMTLFGLPDFMNVVEYVAEEVEQSADDYERTWHETLMTTYSFGKYFIGTDDGNLKQRLTRYLPHWETSDDKFNDDYQEVWDEMEEWIETYDGTVRDEVKAGDPDASRTANFDDTVDPDWNSSEWPRDMRQYEVKIFFENGDKNNGMIQVYLREYY